MRVVQLCEYIKKKPLNYIHFKPVSFVVYVLYLNKDGCTSDTVGIESGAVVT